MIDDIITPEKKPSEDNISTISLVDEMKKAATVDQIYTRMAKATEVLLEQGTQAMGTFIDVDDKIEDKSIKAANRLVSSFWY